MQRMAITLAITMPEIISILMDLDSFLVQEEPIIIMDIYQSILDMAIIIQRLDIIQLQMLAILVFPTSETHWDTAVPLTTMLDTILTLQVAHRIPRVARHTPQVAPEPSPIVQIR